MNTVLLLHSETDVHSVCEGDCEPPFDVEVECQQMISLVEIDRLVTELVQFISAGKCLL